MGGVFLLISPTKMGQCFPKRRNIKFTGGGITKNKEYKNPDIIDMFVNTADLLENIFVRSSNVFHQTSAKDEVVI